MEKEEMLDKMRNLRDKRDLEILKKDFDEINLNSDYNKIVKENKVLDVKYLGKIEYNGEKKDLYLLLEQKQDENGNLILIEKYYTDDMEFLGGNRQGDGYDLMLDPKHMNNKELLENLKNIDKEGLLDLNEIENERLEEIAKTLGIKKEEINKIAEMSTEKIKEAEEKLDNADKENGEDKPDKNKENKDTITKAEIEKVSTKAEIAINQKVTDVDTISSILGVQNKGYTKIAIISSDKLQDKSNTTKFTFVGIKKDRFCRKNR